MITSNYQRLIYTWAQFGYGNAFVNAAAGSGKTTTLVEASKLLKGSILILAFNKHIAAELKTKVSSRTSVRTCHGAGYGCLWRVLGKGIEVIEKKYSTQISDRAADICDRKVREWEIQKRQYENGRGNNPGQPPVLKDIKDILAEMVHLAMVTLTDLTPDSLQAMANKFSIGLDDRTPDVVQMILNSVEPIIAEGERIAREKKIVSYDDMLYLPYRWSIYPQKRFDFVFVDEAQDLSRSQLELALKCCTSQGRIAFFGDRNQRIYGFAGVSPTNVEDTIAETRGLELPLSICYRCPKSHVKLAQILVKDIEPYEKAPEGVVKSISPDDLPSILQGQELILFRKSAPAVRCCLRLLEQNIPAKVRGKDIGKQLANIVRSLSEITGFRMADFEQYLSDWRREKFKKINLVRGQLELEDKCSTILACYYGLPAIANAEELACYIEDLFSDDEKLAILSTVHRAKGLQAKRVIVNPEDMPMTWHKQTDEQFQEELNIYYVALTRATEELIFLTNKPSVNILDEAISLESYQAPVVRSREPLPAPDAAVLGGIPCKPYDVVMGGRNPILTAESSLLLVDALLVAHHQLGWTSDRFRAELTQFTGKNASEMLRVTKELPSPEQFKDFLNWLKTQLGSQPMPCSEPRSQSRRMSEGMPKRSCRDAYAHPNVSLTATSRESLKSNEIQHRQLSLFDEFSLD